MKNLFAFLIVILSFSGFAQHDIKFTEGSFSEIMQKARSENKPVFYMFYAKWCSHCNKMKAEVFTDSIVANFYNTNFICAKQDMEAGEGNALRKQFEVTSFPVLMYFNPNGEVVNRIGGELNASTIITEGKNALDPEKQLTTLRAKFLADVSNADHCLTYVLALRKGLTDANEPAGKYLATQTNEQLVSTVNWKIFANGISDINSREFKQVVQKQKEFASVSSPIRVEKKILYVVTETLKPFVEASDTIGYYKFRPAAAEIHLRKTDSIVFGYDLKILESTKNWKKYKETASRSVADFAWKNPAQLKEIGKVYANYIIDPEALKQSLAWAKRSVELNPLYDANVLVARLNLKLGNKKEALEYAEKAKQMATAYQWNSQEADAVLSQIK